MKRVTAIGGIIVAVLFVLLVVVAIVTPESTDRGSGSLTNPLPAGSQALGRVLANDGVTVRQVTSLDDAVAAAQAGTTLAIRLDDALSSAAIARLRAVPAAVVILADESYSDQSSLPSLTEQLIDYGYGSVEEDPPKAACSDPDALAAGSITPGDNTLWSNDDQVTICFGTDSSEGLYARATTTTHPITVIAGTGWVRNDTITENGNAALALRTLGRYSRLTWYLPGEDAETTDATTAQPDVFWLLPDWTRAALVILLVAGAAAAVWRGRRFGALVVEKLPVAVPASEAASGLGRLYRQAGASGHAAAGLRAATLQRLGTRLGIPSSAAPPLVVERLAAVSGRPAAELHHLFYGPAPATDAALAALAEQLTDFEQRMSIHD